MIIIDFFEKGKHNMTNIKRKGARSKKEISENI